MNLTDREKELLKGMIDRGEPLPPKYRLSLFADAPEVELIWQGKTSEVTNAVLPFQSIEQVDEPRNEVGDTVGGALGLFAVDRSSGRQAGGWSNKLIWGDNKLVLSSLKNGPIRREIDDAGGLKLIYIDPPFDVGADFSVTIEIGEDRLTKDPSVIEEFAYRDTWGRGRDSYIAMLYERLALARDLLAPDGSIYVHVGPGVAAMVSVALDELFGLVGSSADICWKRVTAHGDSKRWGITHDMILWRARSPDLIWNPQFEPHSESYLAAKYVHETPEGRRYRLDNLTSPNPRPNMTYEWRGHSPPAYGWRYELETMERLFAEGRIELARKKGGRPQLRRFLDEMPGVPVGSVWTDISPVNSQAVEDTGYDTQKPELLLDRIINASTNPNDLVCDFFCGSGTTLAVAERLGRKWIGCDLGRFAVHTTRKRMIGEQRALKASGKPYRAFEILNLGKYERQYFVGIDPTLPEPERRAQSIQREEHYVGLILSAFKAERVFQLPPFHGRKGSTMVLVGPIDAPVTLAQVQEVIVACREHRVSCADIVGFEFEMGLVPTVQDEARQKGVTLGLRYIPKDVFDKRAVERGEVRFYDVAYVEAMPRLTGREVRVELKDFGVFYRQDDGAADTLKPGASKVIVDRGQVVKLTKSKSGITEREILTKSWTDWIDYWAVDFDFGSRKETIRTIEDGPDGPVERETWTGNFIFENEWQSYRTSRDRTLELTSGSHEYDRAGKRRIAVKVIDIFGNDTTKVLEIKA